MQEVLPNAYRIEVPLPGSPLKSLNSYVFRGTRRHLVVDTGMNREECRTALLAGLREMGVAPWECDFFLTHMHADHSGLLSALVTEDSVVYCSGEDAARLNRFVEEDLSRQAEFYSRQGFPEGELREATLRHPGYLYRASRAIDFTAVDDLDTIEIGDYSFTCLLTPGHTAGHMCLYEAARGVLVSGDLVLGDITPNVSMWSDEGNPLREYLDSLARVRSLGARLVLPGHRKPFADCGGRIDELVRHHQQRAEEVLAILEQGPRTAYQIASQMTWDMTYPTWNEFPASQKWFAVGEALSHIRYLDREGMIRTDATGGQTRYSLAGTD